MKQSNFVKNTSWVLVIKIIQMLMLLVVGMVLARYLGPTGYGTINYVASYVSFASMAGGLGLAGILVKEIVDHAETENHYLGTAVKLRLVIGLFLAIIVVAIVVIVNPGQTEFFYVAVLESIALLFAGFESINYWFQARHQIRYAAIIQFCGYVVVSIYKITLAVIKANIYWFAFASSLDVIFLAAVYYITYKRMGGGRLVFKSPIAKSMLYKSFPFLVANLMIVVYQKMDAIMLGKMMDTTQVGYYTAAITVCNMWGIVPVALLDIMRPMIMEQKSKDEEMYKKRLKELFFLLIFINVAFSVGVTILAKLIIWILYGKEYFATVSVLRICVWYTCFSYIGSGRSVYLICEGKNRYAQVFCAWGAVINIILNFLMIPRFGINGAAMATLITHVMSDFVIPGCYKETRGYCKYVIQGMFGYKIIAQEIKNFRSKSK